MRGQQIPGAPGFIQRGGAGAGVPDLPFPSALTETNQGLVGAMFAAMMEKKIGSRDWDWFQYSARWLPLAANAAGTPANLQVDSDADFLAFAAVGIARATASPAAQNTDRPFLISARSSGTGADLFDAAADFNMVIGTALQPAWWGMPRLMARSSTYVFTLQNLDAANAFNVRIGFWGIKVYIPGGV